MIIDNKKRILEKLAFKYWKRNKHNSSNYNWIKAEKLLAYIEKRKTLVERLLK